MKPIKICFVSLYAYHYFNPEIKSKFGGAELQLYNLTKELAKDERFDLNFVVGDFGQPGFEIRQGIKLYKFFNPQKGLKYIRAVFGFIKLWKILKKIDADIYIQRAAGLETGEVVFFCKLNKKRSIYMAAHDLDMERKAQYGMNSLKWLVFQMGLKWANLIITQHQSQKEALKARYDKESVVRPSAHTIQDNIDISRKEFILWVARCDEWKQPGLFLKLAQNFPKEKFVIIMPESNDKNFFQKIQAEAKRISNLEFIDYVPSDKIDDYFLRAKIFINTSKTEGFPNTFIQAAKNKVPILSLNVNPDNILINNNSKFKIQNSKLQFKNQNLNKKIGLCSEGDFKKLVEYTKLLLGNEDLWQKMSENAYQYAKENHDIKKIIEQDKKIIFSLMEKDKP